MSDFHAVAEDGTNARVVKNAPGKLIGYEIFNDSAGWYPVYVKFHDTALIPTAGSGVVKTIGVQAGRSAECETFWEFHNGIAITIVKGIQDDDATPIAANDCVVNLTFI